jgi:hypothetical protein
LVPSTQASITLLWRRWFPLGKTDNKTLEAGRVDPEFTSRSRADLKGRSRIYLTFESRLEGQWSYSGSKKGGLDTRLKGNPPKRWIGAVWDASFYRSTKATASMASAIDDIQVLASIRGCQEAQGLTSSWPKNTILDPELRSQHWQIILQTNVDKHVSEVNHGRALSKGFTFSDNLKQMKHLPTSVLRLCSLAPGMEYHWIIEKQNQSFLIIAKLPHHCQAVATMFLQGL